MASIQIDIPDAQVDRVVAALGWTPEAGMAKGPYVKARVIAYLKQVIQVAEADKAATQARDAAEAAAAPDLT